jgi:tetratricopeptide (TPR) repeat protein
MVQSVLGRFSSLPDDIRQQLDMVAQLERQPAGVAVPPQQVRSDAQSARAAALFLRRAVALRQAGRLAEAILLLEQAIAANPTSPGLHYDLGITLQQCHRHQEAVASLRRAAALRPDHAGTHLALGVSLQSLGRNEAAIVVLSRATELAPKLAGAHGRLGQLLYLEQRYTEAQESFRRAAAVARHTSYGRLCEAGGLLTEEKFAEASQVLRRTVARDPGNFEAIVSLAEVLSFLGEFENSAAQYERALALGKDAVVAWTGLVQIKTVTDADRPRIAQVLTYLQREHIAAVTRMKLHFALGKAFDDLRDYESAMQHFDAANHIRRGLQPFDRGLVARHLGDAIAR